MNRGPSRAGRKAPINRTHSRRFARFGDARQSRSVWSACVFSAAFPKQAPIRWPGRFMESFHDSRIAHWNHELLGECSAGVLACECTGRPDRCSCRRRDAAATRSRDGCATRFMESFADLARIGTMNSPPGRARCRRGRAATKRQKNIQHRTSNIQLPMGYCLAPCSMFGVGGWRLDVRRWMFDVRYWMRKSVLDGLSLVR